MGNEPTTLSAAVLDNLIGGLIVKTYQTDKYTVKAIFY